MGKTSTDLCTFCAIGTSGFFAFCFVCLLLPVVQFLHCLSFSFFELLFSVSIVLFCLLFFVLFFRKEMGEDGTRVVIVNPDEKPRAAQTKKGAGFVEFETPYEDLWRAEKGRTRPPIDAERETVLDIFAGNARRSPNKVCTITTPHPCLQRVHMNQNNRPDSHAWGRGKKTKRRASTATTSGSRGARLWRAWWRLVRVSVH